MLKRKIHTLIDDEGARLFAQYRFLLGVSLDGPQQWHDHYRVTAGGQGTYDLVRKGIECLRRHHAEFNILSMVNRVTGELTEFSVLPQQFGDFMCEIFDHTQERLRELAARVPTPPAG